MVQVTLDSHSDVFGGDAFERIRHSMSSFVLRTLKRADLPLA
jgi:hypothetical protein